MRLKHDFTIDLVNGKAIPMSETRRDFLASINRDGRTCYNSEVSNFYHMKIYGKSVVQILYEKGIEMPKCPITGSYPSYRLQGAIVFGKYSPTCSAKEIAEFVVANSVSYQEHVERMKVNRKGDGNPMFGRESWNSGLTKENNPIVRKISEDRKGIVFSDATLSKMSASASTRKVHGHTGRKHSEATKSALRSITINRHKRGGYPKTKTVPHNKVKLWIEEMVGSRFEEEFSFEGFVFDFRVNNFLIEVQGDFFHCNPNTRHKEPKSAIQKKNVLRDARKKVAVDASNFVLLELWEHDILNNEEQVKEKILCLKS